ncbi:MAG: aminotransferase class I/II-fold pyridoxal phosphate-dependent enzyme [Microbacteriaceae bacterium]|nr:aminotransferase class I/II-fold pyridoxal phosphate-dependent enzyme [Microbacteriaceae bacterium]
MPYGHQSIDDSDVAAVAEALRGDWLTMGPAVARFEDAVAQRAGAAGAVAVSNGTAALHTAYAALGVGPGDEVIVPAMTFVATASTAVQLGASVRFVDVEDDTATIDPSAADAAVASATAVIASVGYAGHPADADAVVAVAGRAGARVLDDAAHAIGSTWNGRPVGALADATTFSFFPTKNLTTAEGGAVVSDDPEVLARARRFRSHGLVRDPAELREPDEGGWHQEVHELGLNYRLPDVLAALGASQLARLDDFKRRRAAVFARYQEGLSGLDGVRLPVVRPGADPMWHLYPLRVLGGRRRELYDALRAQGVLVQVNYIPVYWHPYFADRGYRRGMCPVAERFYAEELSLPMYADLTPSDQDRVIDLVRSTLTGSAS